MSSVFIIIQSQLFSRRNAENHDIPHSAVPSHLSLPYHIQLYRRTGQKLKQHNPKLAGLMHSDEKYQRIMSEDMAARTSFYDLSGLLCWCLPAHRINFFAFLMKTIIFDLHSKQSILIRCIIFSSASRGESLNAKSTPIPLQ